MADMRRPGPRAAGQARLREQARKLALDLGQGGQGADRLRPVREGAGGDGRLGAVVDDDRQVGPATRQGQQMRQMALQDEGVQRQAVGDHGVDRSIQPGAAIQAGAGRFCSIGRRPRSLQARGPAARSAPPPGARARSTQPTTARTRGSSAARRSSQSVSRSSACELDHHRAGQPHEAPTARRSIGLEVTVDRRQVRRRPREAVLADPPEVLVGVDQHVTIALMTPASGSIQLRQGLGQVGQIGDVGVERLRSAPGPRGSPRRRRRSLPAWRCDCPAGWSRACGTRGRRR